MATSYDNLYIINYTDINSGTISIPKNSIITNHIDIALVGKGTEYGELLDENILHLLENFASLENPDYPNSPIPDIAHGQVLSPLLEQPTDGQFWFNKSRLQLFVRNNNDQPINNNGVWKALKFRNDISANSGMIAHGQQIPLPVNAAGYNFSYDECSWIVSPVYFDSKINYAECYTDSIGTAFVRYRPTSSVSPSDELIPGLANYIIIGIKGSANHGIPFPTPTPSIFPSATPTSTPVPSITPSITATPGVTATPTPTLTRSVTPTHTVTPTLTRTPTITPSKSIVIGNIWTQRLTSTYGIYDVAYGNGIYVAASRNINNSELLVYTSANGISWSQVNTGKYSIANGYVKFVNGLFWYVGYNFIATSTNGITWTTRTTSLPLTKSLYSITSNGSRLVNVGYNNSYDLVYITYSDDSGNTWNPIGDPEASIPSESLRDVMYANNIWITVGTGYNHTPLILTSPNGYDWTQRSTSLPSSKGSYFTSVAYGNGIWMVVGKENVPSNSTGRLAVAISTNNGTNWTQTSGTVPANSYNNYNDSITDVVFNSTIGKFVAVTLLGRILETADGNNWSEKTSTSPGIPGINAITTSGSQFVAGGKYISNTTGFIISSP